jgi:hypothetical protein
VGAIARILVAVDLARKAGMGPPAVGVDADESLIAKAIAFVRAFGATLEIVHVRKVRRHERREPTDIALEDDDWIDGQLQASGSG